MLRHRRQRWAAMDFLLASYRKQKKWIRLRQLLLLLSRLAAAAILIAMLCGWTGGGQMLGLLGGQTTHHVVILDDSYSMSDRSVGAGARRDADNRATAYGRSLKALEDLTRRLANDQGNHQLTVMRASRAALTVRGGSDSGDAAADLSAQTVTRDGRLINRLMSTTSSPIRTDLVPALDLAGELIESTPADQKVLYIASDFRSRDWAQPERLAESMRGLADGDVQVRMIDCAYKAAPNLAITDVSPKQDVWVAGVPVVFDVTVKNYSPNPVKNVAITGRVIRYPKTLELADPTLQFSGEIESLPTMMIESIAAGGEITKSFQVFVTEQGTHAIEVSLPEDALLIDNKRVCTLPLTDAEKVLVIDNDPDGRGAYHIQSVLNPGSQVRIGAIPDVQPPAFLRSATLDKLAGYRAIYLIDIPEIGENAADALSQYVARGGGLAWFLGSNVSRDSYNSNLLAQDRFLLPAPLTQLSDLPQAEDNNTADVVFGEETSLTAPLRPAGDAAFGLVGLARSWELEAASELADDDAIDRPRIRAALSRHDGKPFATLHEVGQGRILTVLAGLDGQWTNWPGDPTFVVFMLQANAHLWSGAAPPTSRFVDDVTKQRFDAMEFTSDATYFPAVDEPPRVPIEMPGALGDDVQGVVDFGFDPHERVIDGQDNIDVLLRPGVSEWALTRSTGQGAVLPVASVIRIGEGDLSRANPNEIQQELLPLDVKFVSSTVWSDENRTAGSSTLTLLLLGLLGTILAGEQFLAYWASYHVAPKTASQTRGGGR